MDDLLAEFLTEATESLDVIDLELVKFEREPNNAAILSNIFRLVHTIKGTCGFLGLPRLETLAHAAETLMGKYRDGAAVTPAGVPLILRTIDRIKEIVVALGVSGVEPAGQDDDLIALLLALAEGGKTIEIAPPVVAHVPRDPEDLVFHEDAAAEEMPCDVEFGPLPGCVSLDELERAFREAPGPDDIPPPPPLEPLIERRSGDRRAASDSQGDAVESKDGGARNQTIRVAVETLEKLMTTASELVLTRNQLLDILRRTGQSDFKTALQRLSNVTAELQENVLQTRMQPIGGAWQKLPRIVRDLGCELDKKIELEMHGGDTELDRQVLELIRDPLTHMVRNSADHGLESTADRIRAGKPETGTIKLSAYHEGGSIVIEIADDGKGLDATKIRAKAAAQGLATEGELDAMTPGEINKFIFRAGFSTAASVTSVSGRGVGMDVVRTNIELIGGAVDVKSTPGAGTNFRIKIPLTLAIIPALIVSSGGQRFAIPQLSVVELVRVREGSAYAIETIHDTQVLRLRRRLLPLVQLDALFGIGGEGGGARERAGDRVVVVAQSGHQTFGMIVDGVFHTEEIVVKPMPSMLRELGLFSGNTILGDGSVIMIVDPTGVMATLGQGVADATPEKQEETDKGSVEEISSLLLFRSGNGGAKAVPLSLITRLEDIEIDRIERCNGRDVVQYRGTLMPLIYLDEEVEPGRKSRPVLVFTDEERSMGIAVDEIVDIVEQRLDIEIMTDRPGRLGSAIIAGRATEIIDVAHYLPQAFDDWLAHKEQRLIESRRRLLFIDDSAFFRNMLSPLLTAAGYAVTLAASAEEALELRSRGAAFDLIVSDLEMPGMDGIALARTIRSDATWRETPLIALSSHRSQAVIARTREAGFADYVGKFDREGLIETLKGFSPCLEEAA